MTEDTKEDVEAPGYEQLVISCGKPPADASLVDKAQKMAKRNEAGPEEIRCNICRQSCVFRRGLKGRLFLVCESYLSKGCRGKGAGFEKVSFADQEQLQLEAQAKPPMDMVTTAEASCTVNTQDLKRKYEQIKSDQLQEKPKMLLQKLSEAFVEKGHTEKDLQVICKLFWEPRADVGNLARNAPVGA